MLQFEVANYAVSTELQHIQSSAGVQTYAARILKLTDRLDRQGGGARAILQFSTLFDPW